MIAGAVLSPSILHPPSLSNSQVSPEVGPPIAISVQAKYESVNFPSGLLKLSPPDQGEVLYLLIKLLISYLALISAINFTIASTSFPEIS